MEITFLGTGTSQGVPVIGCNCEVCTSHNPRDKRLRTSVHIYVNGLSLVVDTGPDFRQQMLRERITWLDAILFTHEHKDHTAGLDDIRPFYFRQDHQPAIYVSQRVRKNLERSYEYIFKDTNYPGVPRVDLHIIENNPFRIGKTSVTPVRAWHRDSPVFGFRIGDFTYITDANYIEAKEVKKIYGTDVLVINALRREKHYSHFTLDEAVELIEMIRPRKAYLTHISHQLGMHETVDKELPAYIHPAYDRLKLRC